MAARKAAPLGWLQPAVLAGCVVPFAVIGGRALTGRLGADPIASALNQLGLLALVLLLASLACTPAQTLFGVNWPLRVRKTLGVMAFFAALAHLLVYVVLDRGLYWSGLWGDLLERPFIMVGAAAFTLLVPLALTSTKSALKRLGFKAWKRLHRAVYLIGALGVAHFMLRVKVIEREQWVYAGVLGLLLGVRVVSAARDRLNKAASG